MSRHVTVLVAALATACGATERPRPARPALAELVASERAFSALSVSAGAREAFLTYLDDEAITLDRGPRKLRAAWLGRPAARSGEPRRTLRWTPVRGDVSQAGDLGYTLGPYVLHDPSGAPDEHGVYFSVWRKKPEGWRVVLDQGAPTSGAVWPQDAPFAGPKGEAAAELPAADLTRLDAAFAERARTDGRAAAAAFFAPDALALRPGQPPLSNPETIAERGAPATPWVTVPRFAATAASGDLGYTWGELGANDAAAPPRGHYARVWRRLAGGWRIVVDVVAPP